MSDGFLGLSGSQSNTLIVILLLAILGIVSFHFYFNVSTDNGVGVKAGGGFVILPGKNRKQQYVMPAEYSQQ